MIQNLAKCGRQSPQAAEALPADALEPWQWQRYAAECQHNLVVDRALPQALTEQLPDPESRVTLDATDRDIYGVPLPRLAYRVGDYARDAMAAAREAHAEIFGLLGATAVTHSPNFQGAGHIIGTARMGDDPATSVVDAELRSHQHRNLFLLGSAVFPTAGTANPTLTIAALTLRAAARVRDSLAG